MTSAISACEAALFEALTEGVTLADTYQHVPEDTPPPVVIIGDAESSQFDTKGDDDREISVAITAIVQGEQRKPLLNIQEQIASSLNHKTLIQEGWTLHTWVEDESAILLPDAITYLGTTRIRVMAFRSPILPVIDDIAGVLLALDIL